MQKQIELTDKTVLVVGLPDNADRFKMFPDYGSQPYLSYFIGIETHREYVDTGFELAGIHPKLTEEECKKVVDSSEYYDPAAQPYYVPCYKNYINDIWKWTAKESFDTLMQKLECYTVNPYRKPDRLEFEKRALGNQELIWEMMVKKWQEAEQSTFAKWAVLIKNK